MSHPSFYSTERSEKLKTLYTRYTHALTDSSTKKTYKKEFAGTQVSPELLDHGFKETKHLWQRLLKIGYEYILEDTHLADKLDSMNDHLGPPGGSPMRLVPQPMQLERSYDIKAKKDELRRLRAVRDQLRMESRDIMQEIDNSQLAVQSQLTAIGK